MPSIVESVSKRLNRPDARARLADLAGVTPAAARKAIAPSTRAVIGALARAAEQEGGAQPVADLVGAVGSIHADDLIARLATTCPYGSELVDALFGEERERVISVIGGKKAPESEAGGILLGQLAPLVISMVADRQAADGLNPEALAVMIGEEASRSSGAGSAKLGVPALAGIVGVTGAATAARSTMTSATDESAEAAAEVASPTGPDESTDGVVTQDLPADAADAATAAAAAGAAASAGASGVGDEPTSSGAAATVAAGAAGVAAGAAAASLPKPPEKPSTPAASEPIVIDDDGGLLRSPLVALTGVVALAVAVAWLLTQVTSDGVDTAATTSTSEPTEEVAGPTATEDDESPEPEGPTETGDAAADADADMADDTADAGADDMEDGADADDMEDGAGGADADATEAVDEVDDADLVGRVARAVTATGVGDGVAVTSVNGEVTLGGSAPDADAAKTIEDAVAAVDGVVSVTNDIRLIDDGGTDDADADAAAMSDDDAATDEDGAAAPDAATGDDPGDADTGDKGDGSLNELLGLDAIGFEYYAEDLSASGRAQLDEVVDYLKANDGIGLEIQGHTDAIGPASLNQRLGQRRADAVLAYLVEAGIDGGRLTAVGVGETDPVASNDTEAGREANRRIEFVIT